MPENHHHSPSRASIAGEAGAVAERTVLDHVRGVLLRMPRLVREGGVPGGGTPKESVSELRVSREAWAQELDEIRGSR